MSHYSEAKLLGIDLEKLFEERPSSPTQMRIKARHMRKAAKYWRVEFEMPVEQLTVAQASNYAYVCQETIRRWVAVKKIRAVKRKRVLWVDKYSLDAYLNSMRGKR